MEPICINQYYPEGPAKCFRESTGKRECSAVVKHRALICFRTHFVGFIFMGKMRSFNNSGKG